MNAVEGCIIELLKQDHDSLKDLVSQLDSIPQGDLRDHLRLLHMAFSLHEKAEDLIFYPAIRRFVADGNTIASAYQMESSYTGSALFDLVRTDLGTRTTRSLLQDFCQMMIAHQKHEENDPIELLEGCLGSEDLYELGKKFRLAMNHGARNWPGSSSVSDREGAGTQAN